MMNSPRSINQAALELQNIGNTKKKIVFVNPCFGKFNELMTDFSKFMLSTLWKQAYNSNYYVISIRGNSGLNAQTVRFMHQQQKKYDLMFMHHAEKQYYPNVVDFKLAYFPNLWYFNNKGYAGFSDIVKRDLLIDHDETKLNLFYENEVKTWIRGTKYLMHQTHQPTLPPKYLFIPLQVEKDTVMKLANISSNEMCERVIAAANVLNIPVIIKIHPVSSSNCKNRRLAQSLVKQYKNVIISSADIRPLISNTTGVFCINSGVGFEAMCNLKPVFTFGVSDYTQGTFYNCTAAEIVEHLNKPLNIRRLKTVIFNWSQHVINLNYKEKEEHKILQVIRNI